MSIMEVTWNPWHGCRKISDGCQQCYVYRMDSYYRKDAAIVSQTQSFDLPVRRKRNGDFKHPAGTLFWTCFSSDFLLDEADKWRIEAWKMIDERRDCRFLFLTKRIHRFSMNLPENWGDGYDHVTVGCTCENQQQSDLRLPVFMELPVKHKIIIHEPLLSDIDASAFLDNTIEEVVVGGESGSEARICDYDWVLNIRRNCIEAGVKFEFKQTGAMLRKDGRVYRIPRRLQHSQASKADIDFPGAST